MDWSHALCFVAGLNVGVLFWATYTYARTKDHAQYHGETPWAPSYFDDDVEIRWKDGVVESRLKPAQVRPDGRTPRL